MIRFAVALLLLGSPVLANDDHDAGHAQYQQWQSQAGFQCCNDRDCDVIADENVRVDDKFQLHVRIDDEWCPVTEGHYVKTGKSPDWTKRHACILPSGHGDSATPCMKFKCFMDRAAF